MTAPDLTAPHLLANRRAEVIHQREADVIRQFADDVEERMWELAPEWMKEQSNG